MTTNRDRSIGIPAGGGTSNFTQNNITADAHRNGNVNTFASPALFGDGVVMGIVQIFGAGSAQAVPEPATVGLLAASVGLLAATARRLGRRR